MALRFIRRTLLILGTLTFLATPSAIYSCGPFLETAVFAFANQPDGPPEDFAGGKFGIVRPGFGRSYLVVAYRYFSGLKLTDEQQKGAIDVWNGDVVPDHLTVEDGVSNWSKARSKISNLPPPAVSPYAAVSPDDPYANYINCPGEAFQNAITTLEDRTIKFGATAPALREWISGQDEVFANCSGGAHVIPAALSTSDSLLRADRDYQIAAAHFYAREFDEAVKQFDDIANDHSSLWSSISPYLAARALIRKATLVHKPDEQFDRVPMAAAQERLEKILANPKAGSVHEPALRLLNFVRFRTDPDKRVAELDAVILKPDVGHNFKQNLWDYTLLLSRGEQSSDPSDWIHTFYALQGYPHAVPLNQDPDAAKHALARWHETKSLPWLIAALSRVRPDNPDLQPLLAAAKQIPASSRGYLTVQYYALDLLANSGQQDTARRELDVLLAKHESEIPLGSHNLLNDERLKLTTSLEDFLQHAPETPVPAETDFNTGEEVSADPDKAKPSVSLFTQYAAEFLVKRLPLPTLQQVAASPILPKYLRREVARSAWVRSILVGNLESAEKLQPTLQELDTPLWKTMDQFRSAQSNAEKRFAAIFVILQNPGMKPAAQAGLLRSATLGEIDNYHDNWWCTDITPRPAWAQNDGELNEVNLKDRDPAFPFPNWLTDSQKAAAIFEWKKLSSIGAAPNYMAAQVLNYAKQHPKDPRLPQALHLAVRSTRFGCTNKETSNFSKAAFDFLHNHYPESEWAKKTKYYY